MGAYPDNAINTDYFTDKQAYGGAGGTAVRDIKDKNGAVMVKIEGWREDWRIRGIKATYSDGSTFLIGSQNGEEYQSLMLASGECITRLNIQPSGSTSSGGYYRLGAVWFRTTKGREFGIFSRHLKSGTANWIDVGSGLCCGIFGAGGADVDRLGMAILHTVQRASLDNVVYPNLDVQTVSTTPDLTSESEFINGTSSTQSKTLTLSELITKQETWSQSYSVGFGFSVTVSAGIPAVADVEGTSSWNVSSESSHALSTTVTKTQTWTWPVNVAPKTIVEASGRVWADTIDTSYTGKMNLLLVNGKTYSYSTSGVYKGASYSRETVLMTEKPF